jgi:hypothetical protein
MPPNLRASDHSRLERHQATLPLQITDGLSRYPHLCMKLWVITPV